MRKYKVDASNYTCSPPLAATWTEMKKKLTPAFQQTKITASSKSPLSSNSAVKAIERFNYTVKFLEVFERNSNDAKCQSLVTWFARTKSALGPRSSQSAVFLRQALNQMHATVTKLTALI